MTAVSRVRNSWAYGQSNEEIISNLSPEYTQEQIFLAFHAARLLNQWAEQE